MKLQKNEPEDELKGKEEDEEPRTSWRARRRRRVQRKTARRRTLRRTTSRRK